MDEPLKCPCSGEPMLVEVVRCPKCGVTERLVPAALLDTEAFPPPSNWRPIQNQGDLAVFGKLIEELNECSSAAARCVIQGIDESNPDDGKRNRQWLTEEIADVLALAELAIRRFGLDESAIEVRKWRKVGHKTEWLRLLEGKVDAL